MKRATFPLLTVLMVLSLAAGAAAGASLRVSHALAANGLVELVICGATGAETITLDSAGNPVDRPAGYQCGHCADCMATPPITLPEQVIVPIAADTARASKPIRLGWGAPQHVVRSRARGPPQQTET